MIDIPKAIRDFLVEPSPLFTATSTRIWAEVTMPPAGYTPALGAGIAFAIRGGNTLYEEVHNPRVQFKCYGTSPQNARVLWGLLRDRLHEAKTGDFKMALCQDVGTVLQEPETTPPWHFALTFYRFWV